MTTQTATLSLGKPHSPFKTVLIANRGEIAVRIIRTLRDMGIRSVAVYSDADADARHVRDADIAVRLGPAPARESYLDINLVVAAAQRTGADAVHPGYGFLSENPAFAAACEKAGIVFIGPPTSAIELMGDKIAAKRTVSEYRVPTVPGTTESGLTNDQLISAAAEVGFPILIKPAAGGGGKGMRRVEDAAGLPEALASARREASSAFGDDTLLLERFVATPRHIEVQVLADTYGNVIHLGERECSLQRRHQKVIEEAPSPLLDDETRARIGAAACATARSVDYVGAGTVEFIVSADAGDEFFFMEMNTRLQVEHPVTEMVTGIDLVEWQIRIAQGEKLTLAQDDIHLTGHAIEARVYAEDPARGFLPTGGTVLALAEPYGVRVDSGLQTGSVVGSDYDPMLSKVIAYAETREKALRILDSALARTRVVGVTTNIEFLRYLIADTDVIAGKLDTGLLDRRIEGFEPSAPTDEVFVAAAAYRWLRLQQTASADPWAAPFGWRIAGAVPVTFGFTVAGRTVEVRMTGTPSAAMVTVDDGGTQPLSVAGDVREVAVTLAGVRRSYSMIEAEEQIWVIGDDAVFSLGELLPDSVEAGSVHAGDAVRSPMPGTVIATLVESGTRVAAGDRVVVVEAMKMEHALAAPIAGVVELLVTQGDQVKVDQLLARLIPETETEK